MDRDKIIDGLRMTMDLFTFDPTTGEEKDPDDLNDLDRATYDACKGALEILERLDTDSDTISRQQAIDICRAPHMRNADCSDFEMAIMMLPPAQLGANLAEVGTDCISRQAAIDVIDSFNVFESRSDQIKLEQMIGELPPAQLAPDQNGDVWITVPDIDKVTCIYVQESKSKFCRIFYEEQEQPERIKARWLPVGMAYAVGGESAMWGDEMAYHVCDNCWQQALEKDGEEVLSDFCPHCGADMKGEDNETD